MKEKLDVAFIVDSSKSITKESYDEIKKFVIGAISTLNVQPSKTHISVGNFGNNAEKIVEFSSGTNKDIVNSEIKNAIKLGGQRDLKKALDYVDQTLFSSTSGSREDAKKVLVIITGNEINPTKDIGFVTSVRQLKRRDIKIIVVGVKVDDDVVTELSVPDDYITLIENFKELPETLGKVEKHLRGKGNSFIHVFIYAIMYIVCFCT